MRVVETEFTSAESKVLSRYFTNLDRRVFALRNLPEVVKGALFSRYSRTEKSLRRVLLEEFINEPDSGFEGLTGNPIDSDDMVAIRHAEEFYERVLVGYGDDSVAELAGAHVAVERTSTLAAKALEDSRIGISPLEKSTRYVRFDRPVPGGRARCTPALRKRAQAGRDGGRAAAGIATARDRAASRANRGRGGPGARPARRPVYLGPAAGRTAGPLPLFRLPDLVPGEETAYPE